jgi:hypothetical protein
MRFWEHTICFFKQLKLINSAEDQNATRGLKVGKAPVQNVTQNTVLMHFPQRAASLLIKIFNAVLLTHTSKWYGNTHTWTPP